MKRNVVDAVNEAVKHLSAADKALDKIAEFPQVKDAKTKIDAIVADLLDLARSAATNFRGPMNGENRVIATKRAAG